MSQWQAAQHISDVCLCESWMESWLGSCFPSPRRFSRSWVIWRLHFCRVSCLNCLGIEHTAAVTLCAAHTYHFFHVSGITRSEECGVSLKRRWTAVALRPPAREWGYCQDRQRSLPDWLITTLQESWCRNRRAVVLNKVVVIGSASSQFVFGFSGHCTRAL